MKPILSQLLATAQLAEMAYNADPSEHKKAAWQKAQTNYEQAEAAENAGAVLVFANETQTPAPTGQHHLANDVDVLTKTVDTLSEINKELYAENGNLKAENFELKTENSLLKNQLIEKDGKINELEKSLPAGVPVSAKSTAPATTPATAPKPLTGAAKVAAEAKAAKTAAATTSEADEAKKNS